MTTKPKLILTFDPGMGQPVMRTAIDLDEHTAREFERVDPPMMAESPIPWMSGRVPLQNIDDVVKVMKVREFRKEVFQNECWRLGTLLAERMEDAEGWHDVSRIEPAKAALHK